MGRRGLNLGGGGAETRDRGVWTAKTVKRPQQQPAHPQYANYWAPLTRKRHTMPHPAQPQHTNYWAPRMQKRHQQEHRPQRPTESSDPTQHAKGRTGDCPGPRKGATTRRNVTQGGGQHGGGGGKGKGMSDSMGCGTLCNGAEGTGLGWGGGAETRDCGGGQGRREVGEAGMTRSMGAGGWGTKETLAAKPPPPPCAQAPSVV